MKEFWAALFFVFMAEMGDKTQLMTLGFSAKYKALTVFIGVCIATLLINLISVGLGEGVGELFPKFWVNLVAGVAFIAFGIWTLRGDHSKEEEKPHFGKHGPLMTVIIAFFLAELGDKTMLTAIAVASRYHNFMAVWVGSTVGLVASNALAIVAGKAVGDRLSAKSVQLGVAVIYIVSGCLAIGDTLLHR
jgi:putative Ca2+/H+ antiporter (TMEM165/GDT1 family)